MESYQHLFGILLSFAVLALAAGQIGQFFSRARLPLISGFLFAGMLVGPYVLGLISTEAVEQLHFVDEVSLAFIALAAGSELYLREMKDRLRSIAWVTAGNVLVVPFLGGLSIFFLADYIPFMAEMTVAGKTAVSLLAGAILLARSPSSVIAIVNELRAKGPFTRTILGVTMVTDVLVIVVFAMNAEIADALLSQLSVNLGFAILLLAELAASLLLGWLLGKLLEGVLSLQTGHYLKLSMILLLGYGVFALSSFIRQTSHDHLSIEFLLEPLLIAMVGGFVVTNYGRFRAEFLLILEELAPPIYIVFFTLTGAALALDILVDTLFIALILFAVRLLGIFLGSLGGGLTAGDSPQHSKISWMAYVTQAGVGLGLAKEVAVEFPGWGDQFATMIIAVIVLSQIIGPPFLKFAIHRVGEAHVRAETPTFDGVRDAIIFGMEGQALALARQLSAHDWQVRVACVQNDLLADSPENGLVVPCELDLASMQMLEMEHADAIVCLLSDEENYRICEMVYEHYGTPTMVVRLNNRANFQRFHALGALIIEPSTAMVSLLEQFVRAPTATSLLLGQEDGQEVVDVEVRNPNIQGLTLRTMRLPLDTLILSVHRDGHTIISHGYTQLQVGDIVTIVGSQKSLEEVQRRFDV